MTLLFQRLQSSHLQSFWYAAETPVGKNFRHLEATLPPPAPPAYHLKPQFSKSTSDSIVVSLFTHIIRQQGSHYNYSDEEPCLKSHTLALIQHVLPAILLFHFLKKSAIIMIFHKFHHIPISLDAPVLLETTHRAQNHRGKFTSIFFS